MRKEYISKILWGHQSVVENEDATAVVVSIKTDNIDLVITVPYTKNDVVWQAMSKNGELLVQDSHNFDDETELEDFKECLFDIYDVLKAPKFRVSNNVKAIEAFSFKWYFLFGDLG